jgi:quinol monooxygenase YgiN
MVSEKSADRPPASLDELVLSWFRGGAERSARQNNPATKPLRAEVSGPLSGPEEVHYLLSTTIIAKEDAVGKMARLLVELSDHAARDGRENGVLQCAVNQSPDDPTCFIVLERFQTQEAMTTHQKSSVYQKFIREAQPLLEKPFGVFLCKEREGKVSQGYYPFGPAGEGGRDDMIYR